MKSLTLFCICQKGTSPNFYNGYSGVQEIGKVFGGFYIDIFSTRVILRGIFFVCNSHGPILAKSDCFVGDAEKGSVSLYCGLF